MARSKELQDFVDDLSEKAFGKSQTEAMKKKECVFCHAEIKPEDFRDELSRKEYAISGICQKCQDEVFE